MVAMLWLLLLLLLVVVVNTQLYGDHTWKKNRTNDVNIISLILHWHYDQLDTNSTLSLITSMATILETFICFPSKNDD